MKKIIAFCILVLLLGSNCTLADESIDLSLFSYEELIELSHDVIDELVSRPEWSTSNSENPTPAPSEGSETIADDGLERVTVMVKDYVGLNLESCGYTSLGGDRRDYYADTSLLFVLRSLDGAYVDPNDDAQLREYTVIGQNPAPDTPFSVVTYDDTEENKGFEEITLFVTNKGDTADAIPDFEAQIPSPDRETQYVRDYTGRTLQTVGYIAMNGNRYDTYGPDGLIQIVTLDENGKVSEIEPENCKYYVVIDQNQKPNTEVVFTYSDDEDDLNEVVEQSISVIEVTVAMSDVGRATLEALERQEAELRASGALVDLYTGYYEVGVNLEPGNYVFSQLSDSCNMYVFANEEAFESDDGEWFFLYGMDERTYIALKEGMYVSIEDGAAKAQRNDVEENAEEFPLYAGVYNVGTDIEAGQYEMTQLSESCSVYVYQDNEAYESEEGDWAFLYGKGDVEYYNLKDGMVLKISDGAVTVTRK